MFKIFFLDLCFLTCRFICQKWYNENIEDKKIGVWCQNFRWWHKCEISHWWNWLSKCKFESLQYTCWNCRTGIKTKVGTRDFSFLDKRLLTNCRIILDLFFKYYSKICLSFITFSLAGFYWIFDYLNTIIFFQVSAYYCNYWKLHSYSWNILGTKSMYNVLVWRGYIWKITERKIFPDPEKFFSGKMNGFAGQYFYK